MPTPHDPPQNAVNRRRENLPARSNRLHDRSCEWDRLFRWYTRGNHGKRSKVAARSPETLGALRDDGEAVLWFQRAADQGFAPSKLELGRMYYRGQGVERNFEKAVELWRSLADEGVAEGQTALGFMYESGYGVAKDVDQAVRLYEEAAAQGQKEAIQNLATLYASGRRGEEDFQKARELWEPLAEDGDDDAQFGLGLLYYHGHGVVADLETAYVWFYLSAQAQNAFAIEARDALERFMLSGQVEQAKKRATLWRDEHGPLRIAQQEDKAPVYPARYPD
jgi:hypothetical protein